MVVFPTWRDAVHITLLFSWMNFNNSACFGYGFNVTNPSFSDTILKYLRQKYRTSFLHFLISLARSFNSSGVRISFSPAFLMEASSPVGFPGFLCYINYADANWVPCGFFCPKSRFSNWSIVGLSNPFWPMFNHTPHFGMPHRPCVGFGRTKYLLSSMWSMMLQNAPIDEHIEDDTMTCALNLSNFSGDNSFA